MKGSRGGGKRFFIALGASHKSRGFDLHCSYMLTGMYGTHVPGWASNAFLRGWATAKKESGK